MNTERSSGVHRLLSDVADLAELQLQLLSVDGREAGRRGIGALVFLGIAAALLISTLTVALLGFGWVLHEGAGWPIGWSLLAMAALALVLTAAIAVLAYLSIKKATAAIEEVGAEFAENLRWLRALISSPSGPRGPAPPAPVSTAGTAGGGPSSPPDPGSHPPVDEARRGERDSVYSRV